MSPLPFGALRRCPVVRARRVRALLSRDHSPAHLSAAAPAGWITRLLPALFCVLLIGLVRPADAQVPSFPVLTSSSEGVVAPGTDVTLTVTSAAPGLAYEWRRNGTTIPGATAAILELTNIQAAQAGVYTVNVRVDERTSVTPLPVKIAVVGPERVAGDRVWVVPGVREVSSGSNSGLYADYDGRALMYIGTPPVQWYKDDVELTGQTQPSLSLPEITRADAGRYHAVVAGHVSSPGILRVDAVLPEVDHQPRSTWTPLGGTAQFSVVPKLHNFTIQYQWLRNGEPIAGANKMTLEIGPVAESDYGTYLVRLTNNAGTVESLPARLDPPLLPVIAQQPAPQTVALGQTLSLSVVATGDADILPLAYQWSKDNAWIPQATQATYSVAAAAESDAGYYDVMVTGTRGSVISHRVPVTVGFTTPTDGVPVWHVEPKDLEVAVGQTAKFESTAGGRPPYSFQWMKNGVAIPGATAASLVLQAATAADAGLYSVTLTNPVGSITSRSATLVVKPDGGGGNPGAPVITRHPVSVLALPGETVRFSIEVTGTPPISITWFRDHRPITGMTAGPTWEIENAQPVHAGAYYAYVSTPLGSATSAEALLTFAAAPAITSQPWNVDLVEGGNVVLEVRATGAPTPTYQWFRDGQLLTGATQPTLTIASAAVAASGTYTVRVSNPYGIVTSTPATVLVRPAAKHAGVYFGRFGAGGTGGEFAVVVRPDGTCTLIGYLPGSIGITANFPIASDGEFVVTEDMIRLYGQLAGPRALGARAATAQMVGTVDGRAVTGSWTGMQTTLNGERAADAGTASAFAGFYVAGVVNSAGDATYSIVAADGRLLVLRTSGAGANGNSGLVTAEGRFAFDQVDGSRLEGHINPATRTVTGTVVDPSGGTTEFSGGDATTARRDRLINISTRGFVGTDVDQLIAGFVIRGSGSRTVLIRAVGPTLAQFKVPGVLSSPSLSLVRDGQVLATSAAWSGADAAAAGARVGAFPLPEGSGDAVIVTTLDPGLYTALLAGLERTRGIALVEVYDATETGGAANAPRLINISTRGYVGVGEQLLIAGFAIRGDNPKTLLIRGVGPGLAEFGLSGVLADPTISVQQGDELLSRNSGWNGEERLAAAAGATGAFPLAPSSRDAALLLTLRPGNYTALLSSTSGGTGRALIEVYELEQ